MAEGTYDLQCPTVYAVVGREQTIYDANLIRLLDLSGVSFEYTTDVESEYASGGLTITPTKAGEFPLTIKLYIGSTLDATVITSIRVCDVISKHHRSQALVLAGDSLIAGQGWPNTVNDNLALSGNHPFALYGTQQTAALTPHEGHSGKTWAWFGTIAASPMTDGAGVLDLASYIATIGATPTVMVWNLGINQTIGANPDSPDATIATDLAAADVVLDAWLAAAPNCIHIVSLVTPGNSRDAAWTDNYGGAIAQWDWKRIQHRYVELALEHWDGHASIFPHATNVVLDPTDHFPELNAIHPTSAGYGWLAEQSYAALKWHLERQQWQFDMSTIQHAIKDVGGQISIVVRERPTAATVTIKAGDDGSTIAEDQTATVSSINTTLSGAASAGDRSVDVASATGIVPGASFWLTDGDGPDELVKCKSISGTTITLWRKLRHAHASGDTAEGTTLTYAVTAAQAAARFWDGRAQWSLDGALTHFTHVICTDYPLSRLANILDWQIEIPNLVDVLHDDEDPEDILDRAHDDVVRTIAQRSRAHVLTDERALVVPCVLRASEIVYGRRPGDDARELAEHYRDKLDNILPQAVATAPRDLDQDGIAEDHERLSMRTIRLNRA